jgi:hypothetical protein
VILVFLVRSIVAFPQVGGVYDNQRKEEKKKTLSERTDLNDYKAKEKEKKKEALRIYRDQSHVRSNPLARQFYSGNIGKS